MGAGAAKTGWFLISTGGTTEEEEKEAEEEEEEEEELADQRGLKDTALVFLSCERAGQIEVRQHPLSEDAALVIVRLLRGSLSLTLS